MPVKIPNGIRTKQRSVLCITTTKLSYSVFGRTWYLTAKLTPKRKISNRLIPWHFTLDLNGSLSITIISFRWNHAGWYLIPERKTKNFIKSWKITTSKQKWLVHWCCWERGNIEQTGLPPNPLKGGWLVLLNKIYSWILAFKFFHIKLTYKIKALQFPL